MPDGFEPANRSIGAAGAVPKSVGPRSWKDWWGIAHATGLLLLMVGAAGGVSFVGPLVWGWGCVSLGVFTWLSTRHSDASWNAANAMTGGRLLLLGLFVVVPAAPRHMLFALLLACLVLDGLDGMVARWRQSCTAFGAQLDMEVDALSIVVMANYWVVNQDFPPWVLLLGAWRYGFVLWRAVVARQRAQVESRYRWGRYVFLLVYVSLLAGFYVSPGVAALLLAAALVALSASFGVSIFEVLMPRKRAR